MSARGHFTIAAAVPVASFALPDALKLRGRERGKAGTEERRFRSCEDIFDFLGSCCCLCVAGSHSSPSRHGWGCAGTGQAGDCWRAVLAAMLTGRVGHRI